MPQGKGTYGSKRGRPPKKDRKWNRILKQAGKESNNSEEIFSMNPSKKLQRKLDRFDNFQKRFAKRHPKNN